MDNQKEILSTIKSLVLEEIPDAKVYLFGSRVTGKLHEESDWDILVLTGDSVDRTLKKRLHDKLFPFNLTVQGFIQTIIVNEQMWYDSPNYYVLQNKIENVKVLL